ncbi:MAG: DUF2510 domain-containing protein [Acidobacteria bacterium]|nr:DUF2510 domain-containing protein [Acidobacteriota bacterium]
MSDNNVPPGWYIDPSGQGDARYWSGTAWTATVSKAGETVNVAIDPAHAEVPPVPGTEVHLPVPAPTTYVAAPVAAKSSPVLVIGLLLVAFLVVIVIFVYAQDDDSSTEEDPTTETTSAPETTAAPTADTEAPAEGG